MAYGIDENHHTKLLIAEYSGVESKIFQQDVAIFHIPIVEMMDLSK